MKQITIALGLLILIIISFLAGYFSNQQEEIEQSYIFKNTCLDESINLTLIENKIDDLQTVVDSHTNLLMKTPKCSSTPERIFINRRTNNSINGINFEGLGYFVVTRGSELTARTDLHEQLEESVNQNYNYWCVQYNLGDHFCR